MFSLFLATLIGVSQPAPGVEVQMLGGEAAVGTLVELGSREVVLATDKGRLVVPAERLIAVTPKLAAPESAAPPGGQGAGPLLSPPWPGSGGPRDGARVELVDGSLLVAGEFSARGGQSRLVTPGGKAIEIPTSQIRSVRWHSAADALGAEWSKLADVPVNSDRLAARKGEALDSHQGIIREVGPATVLFEVDGEALPVRRSNVYGLLYYHAQAAATPEAVCRLTDADGSLWAVGQIALAGGELRWTTPAGLAAARPVAEVVRIDFSQGKILYLSDLAPESALWTPYFPTSGKFSVRSDFFGPRMDRGLGAEPIELDHKTYGKGLVLHSRTELIYRLPGRFRLFQAVAGIDEHVAPKGNVRLVVQGDDRVLLETTVAGTDRARPLELDLSGVRRLRILVDYGENGDVADQLDLAEARIVK
jgi:hypothetical protein